MIALTATTQSLIFKLGGAATNEAHFVATYWRVTSAGVWEGMMVAVGTSNDTSDVTILAAPTAAMREKVLKTLTIHNREASASITVTVLLAVAGDAQYEIVDLVVPAGKSLCYTETGYWCVTS